MPFDISGLRAMEATDEGAGVKNADAFSRRPLTGVKNPETR
jgi:hypothetical protein